MKTVLLFIALIGLLAATVWWIFDVNSTLSVFDMPAAGWFALIFGVVVSLAVGVGLMFLVFRSNRKGHDEPPSMLP